MGAKGLLVATQERQKGNLTLDLNTEAEVQGTMGGGGEGSWNQQKKLNLEATE